VTGFAPHGLAAVALSLAISSAQAQWWNLNDHTPPKFRGTEFEPKVVYTHQVVTDASYSANAALWNDDFAKLDRMYDEFMGGNIRSIDGTWMVQALASIFEQAGSSPVFDKTLERWADASPRSKLRPLAQAIRLQGDAWRARGGAYGSQVPGESMRIFRDRLLKASKSLADLEPDGKQSPLWYWVALIVAGSSGQPPGPFDALFDEAVGRFPLYQPLYYTRVNYLLPQWGGSYEAVDRFVKAAVARTSSQEGDAFYAWLYVDISSKVDGDLFQETLVSWPRMKKGFEDMVARHPDLFNKSIYATFACRARDKETTARLLAELGPQARLGYRSPGITTESCRLFALTST
jgi:hypothetical protein